MSHDQKDVRDADADRTMAAEKPVDATEKAGNADVALNDDVLKGVAGAGMYWEGPDGPDDATSGS